MPRHARDARLRVAPVAAVTAATALVLGAGVGAAAARAGHAPAPRPTVAAAFATATPSPTPTPSPAPAPEPDVGFSLVAAGDVLPHMPVLRSARTDDGYDLTRVWSGLDPWVRGADLALCHLEVPVAPAGSDPSGFPVFGAPSQVVTGLAAQGWDGCSTASNHAVDRGWAGVTTTLDALDAAGLGHVGTARSAVEDTHPQLYRLERAGRTITVAHLAATYGTNGMPVDADKPWSVTLLDADDVVDRARVAREAGADLVVVSLHWGTEYRTAPTDAQRDVARRLAASGVVDLVIGHHAHVPQPVELLDGGPDGAGMWVAYGLGNYVSNQDESCCVRSSAVGLLLTADVVARGADPARGVPAGAPRVTGVRWTPITVDRRDGHRVRVLDEITEGTATLRASDVADRLALAREAAGTQAPQGRTPGTPTGGDPVVVPRPR